MSLPEKSGQDSQTFDRPRVFGLPAREMVTHTSGVPDVENLTVSRTDSAFFGHPRTTSCGSRSPRYLTNLAMSRSVDFLADVNGPQIVGHSGGDEGFRTTDLAFSPSREVGVVMRRGCWPLGDCRSHRRRCAAAGGRRRIAPVGRKRPTVMLIFCNLYNA
jgi:hypothetical protein